MKFAYSLLRWNPDKPLPLIKAIHQTSRAGWKSFEFYEGQVQSLFKNANLLSETLSETKMELAGIFTFGSFLRGIDYNFPWGFISHYKWKWRRLPKVIKLAASVRCKRLVIAGGVLVENAPEMRERHFRKLAEALNKIGRDCKDIGIEASYHPHPAPQHAQWLIHSGDQIERLFEFTDPDLLHLALDTGLITAGIDIIDLIYRFRERINHVHLKDIKDGRFVDLGEGTIDLPGIIKALKSIGYDDWVTIEDWYPPLYPKTFFESARNSKQYVEKCLAQ